MIPDLYDFISSRDKVTGTDLRKAGLVGSCIAGHRKLVLLEEQGEIVRNKDGRTWSIVNNRIKEDK